MSSSFSTNFGSRKTLKPRTICGFRPLACQCRMTALAFTSSTAPILRVLHVALAPARDLHAAHHAQCLGNVLVLQTRRGQQHDARSQRHSNTRTHSAREPCQLGLLRLAQLKNRGNSQSFAPMQTDVDRWRYLMYLSFLKNQTLH